MNNNIVENDDILQFFAFSKDCNAGDGKGDKILNKDIYKELNKIPFWRRTFSSLYEESFIWLKMSFLSYEYAYQASKYLFNGLYKLGFEFSLESNSNMSKSVKNIKKRFYLLNEEQLEKWKNLLPQIKDQIYKAKFNRNSIAGKALIETNNAILINAGPRITKRICKRLMNLRNELKNTF